MGTSRGSERKLLAASRCTFLRTTRIDGVVGGVLPVGNRHLALDDGGGDFLIGVPKRRRRNSTSLCALVNRDATHHLIDSMAEKGTERFTFASTCSNYGIHEGDALATETSDLNPQSIYAETKIAVETYILENAAKLPYSPTILRFATAYGFSPRMRFDLTVSHFASELAVGGSLDVYDPDTWRPYCHVRDLSKAIMTVLAEDKAKVSGEVFNVGDTGQQFTKRMIVDEALKHLGEREVSYVSGDTDPRNYRVSFDKIAKQIDFTCDYSVERYVPSLINAVQNGVFTPSRSGNRYGNYEIPESIAKVAAG